ncbi:MAG TPA: hypothetical protein DDW94_06585 [Deltaproteobacteria bacterium]|nr:MAG: hypothetical protein A2Z79_01115 [Deltaproteobacteria bacterium GWA2_55_82]OGQ62105.1 MAG: hypothetical protein A3I81_04090 [Deltaproteobacteria bacterium RIFCSPLOWO2_02_FULL_55_12]OIJ74036.1 MAG: hypothetical protein A2V21_307025 [Deltaproteobacteria bacterium GWC2_55_46]HBG46644.1 hypothetical protein [Deltaproteobacteria bacterium]HCY11348.1 hypothetical protein [Deltaproteobacteria bacterium]
MRCVVKRDTWILALVAALILSAATIANSAEHDHGRAGHGESALIEEMRALDAAFREIVSGVAVNDRHRVLSAIELLHGTMEKTQEAMLHGAVKLKRNPSGIKEFERLDVAFHNDLASLARSAREGQKMNAITKKLLDGCVNCHTSFKP